MKSSLGPKIAALGDNTFTFSLFSLPGKYFFNFVHDLEHLFWLSAKGNFWRNFPSVLLFPSDQLSEKRMKNCIETRGF